MDHYKENGCCITAVSALMDGEEVHIDNMFVMPSMRVSTNMATGTEGRTRLRCSNEVTKLTDRETEDVTTGSITTIHELFQKDGHSIRRVCISGDAGQGKTSLCQKIVSAWSKVHANNETVPDTEYQFLKSFDLLFYIPLRNQKTSDVIEMIKTEIVRQASHNALKEVLEKESEKCLIILDGLDEWLPSEDCTHKVPHTDRREKFTVLITSRPWKLEVLRLKTSEIGQEVELNGIKNDKLIETVVNILNNKYAKKGKLKFWHCFGRDDKTYKKVKHLAEIPIILTQMVCMWYDDETFGNTRVNIYSKMVDYLFHMANKRHQEAAWMRPQRSSNKQLVDVFEGFTFCEMYSEIVFKLSDLAYNTLFNEKRENSLVFPYSDTEIYKLTKNDVKCCLFVGILSQAKCLSKASSHTKSIYFLHKTFQEFLAAIYIAYGGNDRSFTVMLDNLKSLDDVFEMSQVLIFLSGLKPDLLGDMSRHIAQLTDNDERVLQFRNSIRDEHDDFIYRLQLIIYDCFVEAPKSRMLDKKLELRDVYFKFFDRNDLHEMIPNLKTKTIKSWKQYSDAFSSFWEEPNEHELVKLCEVLETKEDIDHVTRIVERCASSLTSLSVDALFFDNSENDGVLVNMKTFLMALHQVSHLTCVQMNSVKLTHSDIMYLGTLSQCTQLREISLKWIRCSTCQPGQCYYSIDLSHHKQLQYLELDTLECDIVLSNEVPIENCVVRHVKCDVSIIGRLKSSQSLKVLHVVSWKQSFLHHIKLMFGYTATEQDDEREVHLTPVCLSKVLTDVIPTLKNLSSLFLVRIDFKQDILRLSPELRNRTVQLSSCTMTLQCLQGLIDSLPKTLHIMFMVSVFICPKENVSTALKYITDRHHDTDGLDKNNRKRMRANGCLKLGFTNRSSH